jgi:hypothetical protein
MVAMILALDDLLSARDRSGRNPTHCPMGWKKKQAVLAMRRE